MYCPQPLVTQVDRAWPAENAKGDFAPGDQGCQLLLAAVATAARRQFPSQRVLNLTEAGSQRLWMGRNWPSIWTGNRRAPVPRRERRSTVLLLPIAQPLLPHRCQRQHRLAGPFPCGPDTVGSSVAQAAAQLCSDGIVTTEAGAFTSLPS